MPTRLFLVVFFSVSSVLAAHGQAYPLPDDAVHPDWQSEVPQVVYPDTGLVNLYYKTWEIAAGRVRRGPAGLPASPYLDENCYEDQVWIWDTCFMVMFSKYAPKAFPGKESLLNLYAPIHDHAFTPLRVHLRDNPPLFAWTELANYRFTGDREQAELVTKKKRYLQRHFEFFNNVPKGDIDTLVTPYYNPIRRGVVRDTAESIIGYTWYGGASGMDNTVRGRDVGGYDSILWVDAISQQALSALCIARLCRDLDEMDESALWQSRYDSLKSTINRLYWDEQDGMYYDISVSTHRPCRILTVASFWPMLAEIPTQKQAARMLRVLRDERLMGGKRPWNTLSRQDPDFNDETGEYWRGAIWLPTAYMGTKALERYGFYALADSLAERVVREQLHTYQHYAPHTIWECYSPSADAPSTEYGNRVRPDFCGWSALGPISLFIENVMGFRSADAQSRTLVWDIKMTNGEHGLRRLHFGDVVADVVYHPETQKVEVTTNRIFSLVANGKTIKIKQGTHQYKVKAR